MSPIANTTLRPRPLALLLALLLVGVLSTRVLAATRSAPIPLSQTSATAAFCASPGVKQYNFTLSGPAESPPNASPGTGNGFVILDTTASTMLVSVSFSGLTANTTAAHIHSATTSPGTGTAGVATTTPSFAGFPNATSGTYSKTLNMTLSSSYNPSYVTANGGTTATAFAALCAGIDEGKAYFNIHTSNFTGGEIRGFLLAAMTPRLYLPLLRR